MNRQLAAVLLIFSASLQPSQAAEYVYPGVYLEEGPGPKPIEGVSTSPIPGQLRIVRSCGRKCLPKPLHPRGGKR